MAPLTKNSSEKVLELADAEHIRQLRTERLAEKVRERAQEHCEFPMREHRVIRGAVLENSVLVGLRSLSIKEEEHLSEFTERKVPPRRSTLRKSAPRRPATDQEFADQEPEDQEPVKKQESDSQDAEMSTAGTSHNGIITEAVKVPNVIVTAATGYPLIKTFRGKEGEDVERFLRNVSRYIELKVLNGMYKSDMEQHLDHVTLIYSHCARRVQEYIDTMDGEWEVNPTVVQEGLTCRYRRMKDTGVFDARIFFRRYIQRTQRLSGLCKGCEDLYESLTSRFCRGIRDGVNRKTLISVPGVREQKGKIRFETCMAYAQGLAGTEEEPQSGRRRSAYFDGDDSDDYYSDDSDDSDSDSSDDERDCRRRKGKDRKYRKSLRKQKERRSDKASEKLAELQKMREEEARKKEKEEFLKEKEEVRKEKERIQKEKARVQKEQEEAQKEKRERGGPTGERSSAHRDRGTQAPAGRSERDKDDLVRTTGIWSGSSESHRSRTTRVDCQLRHYLLQL